MNEDFLFWLGTLLSVIVPLWILIALCKFAYWFSERLFLLLGG